MPFYFALAWRLDYFSQTISAKGIPTKQEINGLPRRAMAVFAARCARRVLPLALRLTMLSETQKQAVEAATSWAEAAADDSAHPDRDANEAASAADAIYDPEFADADSKQSLRRGTRKANTARAVVAHSHTPAKPLSIPTERRVLFQ